ncbi:MAG: hypothetical protein KC502_05675 [Myxococcales bacterium]|nr:hypothetical protein [Myxococcales bacterium]
MKLHTCLFLTFAMVLASVGCSPDTTDQSPDAAAQDVANADVGAEDAANTDTAPSDSGNAAASDAGLDVGGSDDTASPPDAANDDAGAAGPKTTKWGKITGACGTVGAEVGGSGPSFLVNTFTFNDAAAFSPDGLSTGATKRYNGENAGGSSICSEVMSMQVLHECEGAVLYKTEKEIVYTSDQGAITDYETTLAGEKIGVSVTRAYKGPTITTYTDADAVKLLTKKLGGVLASTAKVSKADKWKKQILHIWTLRPDWVPTLKKAWMAMSADLKADTIVLVSIEVPVTGSAGWIVPDDCGVK